MRNILISIGIGAVCCAAAAMIGISKGIEAGICIPVAIIFFVIVIVVSLFTAWQDKKSFGEAARLREGNAFKSAHQQSSYEKWARGNRVRHPKADMRSELIADFRSWAIVFELLGVLVLVLILIILYGELELAVRFILLGCIIILLYLACSDIFGLRAGRLYGRLAERPDIDRIERSYAESSVVGTPRNRIAFGSAYIILLTNKGIFAIPREKIRRVCRADILGYADYNGSTVGREGSTVNFLRLYVDPLPQNPQRGMYCVKLTKYYSQLAFELAKENGLATDETIEIH